MTPTDSPVREQHQSLVSTFLVLIQEQLVLRDPLRLGLVRVSCEPSLRAYDMCKQHKSQDLSPSLIPVGSFVKGYQR
jgi:hypothetical protein